MNFFRKANNFPRHMSLYRISHTRVMAPEKMEIHLTDVEQKICELLHDCTQFLQTKGITTTCRIAGGWVRDKLLGLDSNDIDIALSDMKGLAFAEHLKGYAHSKGLELGAITKIEQNPDQSKHLETATLRIFGLDVDLVNLRSEEYAEGSRIPTEISFGTPVEDALRRDITINALFYNVHNREVEDLTEKGLADLRDGIIRTPMPAMVTFMDDPLRILRCIRFSSRFGFDLVPELKSAAKDPIIHEALIHKVSRERVGDEVSKMVKGRDPLRASKLIHELSLYQSIFSVIPINVKLSASKATLFTYHDTAVRAAAVLYTILNSGPLRFNINSSLLSMFQDSSSSSRLYLAALLLPFIGQNAIDNKNKSHLLVADVIRHSLKLGTQNHYLDGIPVLFSAIPLIQGKVKGHSKKPFGRVELGLFLRNKLVHNPTTGNHWSASLLFSMVVDLEPFYNPLNDSFEGAASNIVSYNGFIEAIYEFGLQNDFDTRPLLNGREVAAVFGVSKTGPWIGKVLDDIVQWQLEHPSGSKIDCLQWLKGKTLDQYDFR